MRLSVVVPIYNVEKYLPECLASFERQSHQDFELFLIDDSSTDKSGEIAANYAKTHANCHYLREGNKGPGGARNTGLSLVKSEYVTFVDSDDFVGPRFVENILRYVDDLGGFDMGLGLVTIFDMQLHNYVDFHDIDICEDIFKDKLLTNVKEHPELFSTEGSFSRCVFNVEFLKKNNFAFKENMKWEDLEPHFYLIHNAEKVAYLNFNAGYYYRVNSAGAQTTLATDKSRLDIIKAFADSLKYGKTHGWSDGEYIHFIRTVNAHFMWTVRVVNEAYRKEFTRGISKIFRKIKLKYFFAYRKLPVPYRPYNKRFLVALAARSILLRWVFYRKKTSEFFHKVWRKLKKGN